MRNECLHYFPTIFICYGNLTASLFSISWRYNFYSMAVTIFFYKPQENLSLYVSYSESFLPRSGEQFKSLSSSSARLDPDVFESTEIGVKWDIRDNLSFTVSYFDSEQTQAVRDSDTGENSEIVGLQVDGIELELKGQVSDKLYLALGYSDLDGETGKGGEPREIPEQTASLWATYQVNDNLSLT